MTDEDTKKRGERTVKITLPRVKFAENKDGMSAADDKAGEGKNYHAGRRCYGGSHHYKEDKPDG